MSFNDAYKQLEFKGVNSKLLHASTRASVIANAVNENFEFNIQNMINESLPFQVQEIDKFFRLVSVFQDVFKYRTNKSKSKDICHEFVRRLLTGEANSLRAQSEGDNLVFLDAIRFVKTIQESGIFMSPILFDVVDDKGDDGYGDLLDSICLAGREVYQKIMCGAYQVGDYDKLKSDVRSAVGVELAQFILNGENYIAMFTTDKVKEFFYSWVVEEMRNKSNS